MSRKISDAQWARFKRIIDEFHDDAFQDEVKWSRLVPQIKRAGEDRVNPTYNSTTIKGLFYYNYFRTWPITEYVINGEYDKQSEVLLLNLEYLKENGWLDDKLRFAYTPYSDVFEHRGQTYEATGDSFISQAKGTPLLFMVILKRRDNIEQVR